jgi:hypothetical protein
LLPPRVEYDYRLEYDINDWSAVGLKFYNHGSAHKSPAVGLSSALTCIHLAMIPLGPNGTCSGILSSPAIILEYSSLSF